MNILTLQINAGSGTLCMGENIDAGSTYYQYLWSTGATTYSIVPTTTGWSSLTVYDYISGCSDIDSAFVTVNLQPTITALAMGPTSFCAGGSVLLTTSGSTGSYQWYMFQTALIGATQNSLMVSTQGPYFCRVTDASNTCFSTSNTIAISIPCQQHMDPVEKTVAESLSECALIIFPNPGSGIFDVQLSKDLIPVELNVHDASGRLILQQEDFVEMGKNQYRFNLTSAKSGVYFMQMTNDKGNVYRVRVIKMP